MKTPDDLATKLDEMYGKAHPSAEKFIKSIIRMAYEDAISLIEEEHAYDDGLNELLYNRMQEILGEDDED